MPTILKYIYIPLSLENCGPIHTQRPHNKVVLYTTGIAGVFTSLDYSPSTCSFEGGKVVPEITAPIDTLCQSVELINDWMCQNYLLLNKDSKGVSRR